jgi:DNA-directed RNA polymerase specialized sigma24 family protein
MKRTGIIMAALMEQAQELQFLSNAQNISFSDEVDIDESLFAGDVSAGETYRSRGMQQSEADMRAAMSDTIWRNLYPALHSLACYLVHTSPLPYWRGQEDDLADDIAQETVRRVIERAQKAERGEAAPIQSLKQMANTVAYNYYRDLKRHDFRLSRLDTADASTRSARLNATDVRSDEYLLDLVADKVDQDRLFDLLADEISHFPAKQKQAILIDLANRMYFDEVPTSLQESFLEVGIELRHYRQPLPENQRERGRHISLCSQAYKRVARLPSVQE